MFFSIYLFIYLFLSWVHVSFLFNDWQLTVQGFTGTFSFTHLLQSCILMRQMEDIWRLCVVFRVPSVIIPPLLFCLDSDSSNDTLISALWCNSSSSSIPRRRTGVIASSNSPRRLNEGWRAASARVTVSTGLRNSWYPFHSSSTLRTLPTFCRRWSHRANLSCSLEPPWC